jgi:ABC-type nitrate/sulfonate/bicarbonate transport system substrate-binding protein
MSFSLQIAHIGLLDAAPLLAAQEHGFFAAEGVELRLSCELGLASICGKLVDRRIDAACLPAPLPVLLSLGAGVPRVAMRAVQVCARQGMGLVMMGPKAGDRTAGGVGPRLGVITPGTATRLFLQRLQQSSPHLAIGEGAQVPVAASQLLEFLREGVFDGFCGIDPWPALARQAGAESVAESSTFFPMHPGSVVAMRAEAVEDNPRLVAALGRVLQRARTFCSDPVNREELWRLVLAQAPYAGLSTAARAAVMAGEGGTGMRFDGRPSLGGVEDLNFLEAACRGAIGPGSRGMDLKAEITRVFAPCSPASAVVGSAG